MKLFAIRLLVAVLFLGFLFSGCTGGDSDNSKTTPIATDEKKVVAEIIIGNETELLLKDLEENGDYVNSRQFPSLIKASSVSEILGSNIHIVDIRSNNEFSKGHLPGAVRKDFSDLPTYFMSGIKPFEFDRIVLVSSDGQLASYTTSLLRLMGYGNVFALRWGMSSWNNGFAEEGWLAGCSSEFEANLESGVIEKPEPSGMPDLNTGLSTGEEIGMERFRLLFEEEVDKVMISAETVFANTSDYYVINYDRRDKYESGHIAGAVRYKPGATLSIVKELATIPIDKTVVIYCGTGHNSGFVTAYLRLFGYDARTLKYGNNGFMFDKMRAEKATLSWLPFSSADINDYELVR